MNIHPPLSAFPVTIVVLLVIAEAAQLTSRSFQPRHVSTFLLVVLALFFPITYLSGYIGAEYALDPSATFSVSAEQIDLHRNLAQLSLFSLVPLLLLGYLRYLGDSCGQSIKWLYRASVLVYALLVCATGYLGGQLVFTHGAGVYAPSPLPAPLPHSDQNPR